MFVIIELAQMLRVHKRRKRDEVWTQWHYNRPSFQQFAELSGSHKRIYWGNSVLRITNKPAEDRVDLTAASQSDVADHGSTINLHSLCHSYGDL